MIDILVNMLSPIFVPMGVSIADLTSYLTMCKNYVYAILALIIALVVIQVGTHFWVKKGTRHIVRWSSALAFVLAVVLVANLVCFGPLYNNISGALNATSVNLNEDTEQQSKDTIKQVGEEGLVLVKNDGLLPLSEDVTSLNVFGWDSTNPLFGGVGSGSSDGSSAVGIIQSLQDAGYQTNEELTKMFEDAGLSKDDEIVTYCTGGIRSAYTQLVMEMCGFEHTYNYDQSFWRWTVVGDVE